MLVAGQCSAGSPREELEEARFLRSEVDPASVAEQLTTLEVELDAVADRQARGPSAGPPAGDQRHAPGELFDRDRWQGVIDTDLERAEAKVGSVTDRDEDEPDVTVRVTHALERFDDAWVLAPRDDDRVRTQPHHLLDESWQPDPVDLDPGRLLTERVHGRPGSHDHDPRARGHRADGPTVALTTRCVDVNDA